jgi:hypothetical protein
MSVEITIDGLNARQKVLADMIWACDSRAQINTLIRSLPTVQLQDEAKSIMEMMILATIEQAYDGLGSLDEAEDVLKKIAKKT